MSRLLFPTLVAVTMLGCGGKDDDKPRADKLLDTGWFTDTGDFSGESCRHQIVDHNPAEGERRWYWRDHPTIWVDSDLNKDRYEVFLVDEDGVRVPSENVWGEGLSFDIVFEGGLKASHGYDLYLRDCMGERIVPFRTSSYGAGLESGPAGLVGKTYVLDLATADWVQPPGLGPLLQLYFTVPILLGVESADNKTIDFLAAPGRVDVFEGIVQDETQQSWDFPGSNFTTSPYFSAEVDEVNFAFEGVDAPVHSFFIEGTFDGDGSSFGGGTLKGNGDTRNLGGLLGEPDNPYAMCSYAEGLGVPCQACEDGEVYCLDLEVTDLTGTEVPGLTLKRR